MTLLVFLRLHGGDGAGKKLGQLHAEHLRALPDHVTAAAGGEFFVLEFLVELLGVHALEPGGPHFGRRADEPGQLVGGEEHLFHVERRLHVCADAVAVADHCVDQRLVQTHLMEHLVGLDAVLLRPKLKVDVVEHTHAAPEVHPLRVVFLGKLPHHLGDDLRVLQMEGLFIVLLDQFERLVRRRDLSHIGSSAF